jgi:hypothetical protein
MTGLQTRGLALVWLLAFALPIGGALAAGTEAASGTGAAGAVGGGAPAGKVGGGSSAGQIGSGATGSNNAVSDGAAGKGNPSTSAQGMQVGADSPIAGAENAQTTGGGNGGTTGASPKPDVGGAPPPPVMGQGQASEAPSAVQGVAEQPPPPQLAWPSLVRTAFQP